MNGYLKEIGDLRQITKEIIFHMVRHTFAASVTLTTESVSKMLGHRNIQATRHYARVLDKKVSEDLRNLRSKFVNQHFELAAN